MEGPSLCSAGIVDGEVIVHAYEEYGVDCLKKFNGMFALCIYDTSKRQLFLARDRIGIKPLYYYYDKKLNRFAFASEIKVFLEIPEFKKEINLKSLNNYFTYRYIPGEETIFNRIKRLLPGHILFYEKTIVTKKYWDLKFSDNKNSIRNNAKYLSHLLENSVKTKPKSLSFFYFLF